jgi:heme-degrading monooxygenase HmoA
MWNLKEEAGGKGKAENAAQMKEKLEGLVGQVPGLLTAEVSYLNFTDGGYDVALVSTHTDREALAVYQNHPAHLAVKAFVHSVVTARVCHDAEI